MQTPTGSLQHAGQCSAQALPRLQRCTPQQRALRGHSNSHSSSSLPTLQHSTSDRQLRCCSSRRDSTWELPLSLLPLSTLLLDAGAASAATDFSKGSYAVESYWASLGLFMLSFPGLYSQVKRAPKSKKVRKTYEVAGPGSPEGPSSDVRARTIFAYFKKYNYTITETGEVINFQGIYKASKAQAAATVFYVFCGMASLALVLTVALPFGGNYWYGLTALSPLAGAYYWSKGTREENFKVKMVTADDEQTTDIIVEGDDEEAERLRKELGFAEKGKVYVKGLLENLAGEN